MRANRSTPAKDFIEALDVGEQIKLDTLFRRMADTGKVWDDRKFKQVRGKIYEFKRYQTRVGCFRVEDRWILTHGFVKKAPRWPRSEIERAERIMNEHLGRETGKRDKRRQRK
ncbi:MAG: type II toxin-antitoxin system RelE/ParE family toxin [Phycisphaerae bacterium]